MKTGIAFPDFVRFEKPPKRYSTRHDDSYKKRNLRGLLLPFFLFVFVAILIGKLFFLQLLQKQTYEKLSDNNRIRKTFIHAQRGIIFDRNGVPLVFNTPGFRKKINGKTLLFQKDQVLEDIATGSADLEIDSLRHYPYGADLAHIVGYIGEISENGLKDPDFANYKAGDLVGKSGIEQEYEKKLKGIDGGQLTEVDALGKKVRSLGKTDPIPGENITITIDTHFQQQVASFMNEVKKGAAIVSTPQGEIVALVSKPSFDPNLFTMGSAYRSATQSAYPTIASVLLDSENQPILNRAIAGIYPPGSTFKLVTAAAGLESKAIDDHYIVNDTGVLKIGPYSFANWYFTQYGRTEGSVDIVKAIKRSNDIFFYKAAESIGPQKLSDYAKKFGVGITLGIDLPGAATGLAPNPQWKEKHIGESWYLGDTMTYGIGQSFLLTTPLQVNSWTQAIANKGILYTPHLLMNHEQKIINQGLLTQKNFELIRQGMIEACSPGGVAYPLFNFRVQNAKLKIDKKNFFEVPLSTESASLKNRQDYRQVIIACKTGTAEHGDTKKTEPHAWITLFAPAYNPQIVVTVLSESSGEGSSIAGPVAKKILEAWFSKQH